MTDAMYEYEYSSVCRRGGTGLSHSGRLGEAEDGETANEVGSVRGGFRRPNADAMSPARRPAVMCARRRR